MEENRKPGIPRRHGRSWAQGYILLYMVHVRVLSGEMLLQPEALKGVFQGGFGSVMYVDYLSSDVGPYNELLSYQNFIFQAEPVFHHQDLRVHQESVSGGRNELVVSPRNVVLRGNQADRGA